MLVNVRLVTSEAIAMGVDLHVCEVQLVLKEMANLKVAIHVDGVAAAPILDDVD